MDKTTQDNENKWDELVLFLLLPLGFICGQENQFKKSIFLIERKDCLVL